MYLSKKENKKYMFTQIQCYEKHFGKFHYTFSTFHFQNTTLFQMYLFILVTVSLLMLKILQEIKINFI